MRLEGNTGKSYPEYNGNLRPIALADGVFVKDMAAGNNAVCAIDTNQNLFCWGANYYGKLGYTRKNLKAYGIDVPNYVFITSPQRCDHHGSQNSLQ